MFVHAWVSGFDVNELFFETCSLWKGDMKGTGVYGKEAHNAASLKLDVIPFSDISFETFLNKEHQEFSLSQEDRFRRSYIRRVITLDIRFFIAFWRNHEHDPNASWLEKVRRSRGVLGIDFMGTWIRNADGDLCFPCFICISGVWSPSLTPLAQIVGGLQTSACLQGATY